VLGPIVGLVASLQAAEALKILSGRRERVTRKMAVLDVWRDGRASSTCRRARRTALLRATRVPPISRGLPSDTATLCGRNAVQIRRRDGITLDLDQVAKRLGPIGAIEKNRFLVRADIDSTA